MTIKGSAPALAAVIMAAAIAACGSTATVTKTGTSTTSTGGAAEKAAACAKIPAALGAVSDDAGTLVKHYGSASAEARMATDAGQLAAYLQALEPILSDPGQKATVSQYSRLMTSMQTAMQSTTSATAASASGEITGIADQTGTLLPKLTAICGP